jgi:hypothetical protein
MVKQQLIALVLYYRLNDTKFIFELALMLLEILRTEL